MKEIIHQSTSLPKRKPSYAFIILSVLFGFVMIPIIGAFVALIAAIAFERRFPPQMIKTVGLPRNRTKGVINLWVIYLLIVLIDLNWSIAQNDMLPALFGNSSGARQVVNLLCSIIAGWLGWQAYLAKRVGAIQWMWVFGAFAVAFLPFLHFQLGVLWIVIDLVLILVLGASVFLFRLPTELPGPGTAKPGTSSETSLLEEDLVALKRMFDQGLLNKVEYEAKRKMLLEGAFGNEHRKSSKST